jgi:hypothetical protein
MGEHGSVARTRRNDVRVCGTVCRKKTYQSQAHVLCRSAGLPYRIKQTTHMGTRAISAPLAGLVSGAKERLTKRAEPQAERPKEPALGSTLRTLIESGDI